MQKWEYAKVDIHRTKGIDIWPTNALGLDWIKELQSAFGLSDEDVVIRPSGELSVELKNCMEGHVESGQTSCMTSTMLNYVSAEGWELMPGTFHMRPDAASFMIRRPLVAASPGVDLTKESLWPRIDEFYQGTYFEYLPRNLKPQGEKVKARKKSG